MNGLRKGALALLVLAALGGGLRWGAERWFPSRDWIGDEKYYARVAANLAGGNGHLYDMAPALRSVALRPPAYPWVLSLVIDADRKRSRERMIAVQLLLGTVLVPITAALGLALFDRRVGLAAGVVAALYPAFIAHSYYFWSETFKPLKF